VHGANRLGGNSLLETIVFGRRAGIRAGEYARTIAPRALSDVALKHEQGRLQRFLSNQGAVRAWQIRDKLGKTMSLNLGLVRTRDSILFAKTTIESLKAEARAMTIQDKGRVFNTDLIQTLEVDSLLDVAETIVAGALARTESRGAHYRSDFPQRDDAHWLQHTLAKRTPDGPVLTCEPVTITSFPPTI
ncbi:MAG TPA: succinate dehydrogenase/fumarate reductase flavoprotein subunit, partial [Nitrospiraceae bacterium]